MKKTLFILLFSINLFASERIVTLSPSLNEIVFALGSGKNIVANTQYCNFPEESKAIPKIGGYSSISLEKLLLSNPSLILTPSYDKQLLDNMKKLKLPFHSFKTNNLKSIKTSIEKVAVLLNKEKEAKVLNEKIDSTLKSLENIVSNKSFMIVISPRVDLDKSIYISGNNLYFNDILKASGNINAYTSESLAQPVVNVEKIISMNPDVIILLAPYLNESNITSNELKKPWLELPTKASKSKSIYIIDKEYAGIPSNRVVNFMEDFKEILEDVRSK